MQTVRNTINLIKKTKLDPKVPVIMTTSLQKQFKRNFLIYLMKTSKLAAEKMDTFLKTIVNGR